MQSIRTLNDMIVFLQQRGDKKKVAVVCANDASTRYAVEKGRFAGFRLTGFPHSDIPT